MSYREPPGGAPLLIVAFNTHVFGMDRQTGKRVWHHDARAVLGWSRVFARIDVDDDLVLALSAKTLIALDYLTGAHRWTVELDHDASTLMVDREQIFAGGRGQATALTRRGEKLWHDLFEDLGDYPVKLGLPGAIAID